MSKYYEIALQIIKEGNEPTIENVMGSLFPGSDFNAAKIRSAKKAILDVIQKRYILAVKCHPRWNNAVLSGRNASDCLRIWKEEGGNSYLQKL